MAPIVIVQPWWKRSVLEARLCSITALVVVVTSLHSSVVSGSNEFTLLEHSSPALKKPQKATTNAAPSMRLSWQLNCGELCKSLFSTFSTGSVMGSRCLVFSDCVRFIPLTTYCRSVSRVGSCRSCWMWWKRIALR